jgi:branched-chain amino acid transport system permease protein
MVVLGGMQAMFGPLIGALTFLLLEEGLSRVTDYSNLVLGPFLLLVAVSMHGGIDGLISGVRRG